MSLEIDKVIGQIAQMAEEIRSGEVGWQEHLDKALNLANEPGMDAETLRTRIERAKVTWLVSEPVEGISSRYPAPTLPDNYGVVSVDGSSIDSDRHGPARCYLINLGLAALRYGSGHGAELRSEPRLYAGEEDLVLRDPDSAGEQAMTPALVGIRRSVEEVCYLLKEMRKSPPRVPTVCLLDGTLVPIGLIGGGAPEFVRRKFLEEGLLEALDGFRELAESAPVALASYISYPGSVEVVNSLRVQVCPHTPFPDCDRHCSGFRGGNGRCGTCVTSPEGARECDVVSMIRDRDLFGRLLGVGERSGLFASRSSIVRERYREHHVEFFYVNVGEEVGRVEMPRWASREEGMVDLVHSVVLEQCRLGQGYPLALAEAHEQAVLSGGDREEFWRMVDIEMGGEGLGAVRSAKASSKQTRWV